MHRKFLFPMPSLLRYQATILKQRVNSTILIKKKKSFLSNLLTQVQAWIRRVYNAVINIYNTIVKCSLNTFLSSNSKAFNLSSIKSLSRWLRRRISLWRIIEYYYTLFNFKRDETTALFSLPSDKILLRLEATDQLKRIERFANIFGNRVKIITLTRLSSQETHNRVSSYISLTRVSGKDTMRKRSPRLFQETTSAHIGDYRCSCSIYIT